MSIELSPQLETALTAEATRRGTTPSELAAVLISSQLPSAAEPIPQASDKYDGPDGGQQQTLYDRWRAHFESLPKPPPGEPPTNYSQDTGRRFAEAMVEKRRQGRL